jgi:hypothetical protein
VPAQQNNLIKDYLSLWGRGLQDNFRIVQYENLVQHKEFKQGIYVLCALDRLNPDLMQVTRKIYQQLQPLEGFRFLNNPKTLRRFELLTELRRLGFNEFRAVRATGSLEGLRFPVFIREERDHQGAISPLLGSQHEIYQALGKALIKGHDLANLLVIEFCDTSDKVGLYRKYAAYIVGDSVIAQSLDFGRHWMLKYTKTEVYPEFAHEELDFVMNNPHKKQLLEIFKLAQVDYGRIDYAIHEGKVQTWEINLYPTIETGLLELQEFRDQVRRHFYQEFERAWRTLDISRSEGPAIRLNIKPETFRGRDAESGLRHKLLGPIITMLQPAKPLIEPLIAPFLLIIGRLAHWIQQDRV